MKRSLVNIGGLALIVVLVGSAVPPARGQNGTSTLPSNHGTPFLGQRNLPAVLTGQSPFAPSFPQSSVMGQVPGYTPYGGYPNSPYYPSYPSYPSYPTYPSYPYYNPWAFQRPATNNQANNNNNGNKGWHLDDPVRPPPTTIDNKPADPPPAEDQVHLHFLPFTVTGVKDTTDTDRLTRALEKMKGVKGASVKRRSDSQVYVKVWFSDKETVEADAVVKVCTQLGFAGALADD